MMDDETIQLGYLQETGKEMSDKELDAFIALCVIYRCLVCDSYIEAQQTMLIKMRRKPFQTEAVIHAAIEEVKVKYNA